MYGYDCIVQTEAETRMHERVCVEIAPIQRCLQGCGEYDWLTFLAYQNRRLDSVIFQELRILIFFPLLFVDRPYIWELDGFGSTQSKRKWFCLTFIGYLSTTSFTDLKYN